MLVLFRLSSWVIRRFLTGLLLDFRLFFPAEGERDLLAAAFLLLAVIIFEDFLDTFMVLLRWVSSPIISLFRLLIYWASDLLSQMSCIIVSLSTSSFFFSSSNLSLIPLTSSLVTDFWRYSSFYCFIILPRSSATVIFSFIVSLRSFICCYLCEITLSYSMNLPSSLSLN